ncbi:Hypothetical predicted protein, partial [Marmota monax]
TLSSRSHGFVKGLLEEGSIWCRLLAEKEAGPLVPVLQGHSKCSLDCQPKRLDSSLGIGTELNVVVADLIVTGDMMAVIFE